MTEQITNVIRRLGMHFYRSKSTLESLKSVFKVFKGKLSLGAPIFCDKCGELKGLVADLFCLSRPEKCVTENQESLLRVYSITHL